MKLFISFYAIFGVTFAAQKIYEVFKVENCKGDQPISAYFNINNNGTVVPNKVFFSGFLEIREKVMGPIEFSFDSNRCDASMKKCEKFSTFKAPGVCEIFQAKSGVFTEVINSFKPRLTCPFMPGKYTAKDSVIDLSTLAPFPAEGFIWVVTVKAISGGGKNKKLAMCMYIETKISKVRENKKKKN